MSLLAEYEEKHKLYKGTPKEGTLLKVESLMLEGHNNEATAILNTLSSKEQVLARVMDIIKDKPVFVTLRKIMDGRTTGRYEILKGLSSLFTHVAIECEKGSVEYAEILKDIHSLLGEKLYE